MVQINFNVKDTPPATGFEALPAGAYVAVVEATEMKATKAGDGKYLQITFQVVDGEHANRKLWSRLNVENPSEEAQRIGRAELSALAVAAGVPDMTDTDQLNGKIVRIHVIIEKRKDTGEMTNRVKSYSSASKAPAAPTAAPSNGKANAPAWAR